MSEYDAPSSRQPKPRVQPLTDAGRPDMAPGIHVHDLFAYIREMSSRQQIIICGLACLVAALETVPLDLQRHMVNQAIGGHNLRLLTLLGGGFLLTTLVQGGLKYALRVYAGAVSEDVIRNARRRIFEVVTTTATNPGESPRSGPRTSVYRQPRVFQPAIPLSRSE